MLNYTTNMRMLHLVKSYLFKPLTWGIITVILLLSAIWIPNNSHLTERLLMTSVVTYMLYSKKPRRK